MHVGLAEQRVLAARLQAARAVYNACLGEARTRWFLVKQSRSYQHACTLPRHTSERTETFRAARSAQRFTEAALQTYAKDYGRRRASCTKTQLLAALEVT